MQRLDSSMSATELQEWRAWHEHTYETGAEALGVSRAMFARYLAGERPIPATVALLVRALDEIDDLLTKYEPEHKKPR